MLVCLVVSVSVSSQLPLLLHCLLPSHVQSGGCSTSQHPNVPAWGPNSQPHPGSSSLTVCVCLCECAFVYVLRHTYFVKFARIVTLYYLNLLKSRLKGFQNGSFLEGLSKMAPGLIFIVYMSTLKSFWMYLIVLCLYIYVCVQKRAQDGEKGKVCMWLSA